MKPILLLLTTLLVLTGSLRAQDSITGMTRIDGKTLPYIIDDCGDTLIVASLDDVSITTPREFENYDEYKLYQRYRRYAVKVYPYAVEAIRIFREVEDRRKTFNKKKEERRYMKDLKQQLKEEFSDPLKKLTKTQGYILIKMIERELDTPMYFLIKDLRDGLTARYWNTVGGLYGHRLRDGYIEGEDPILDAVLQDLDISYDPELSPTVPGN